MKSLVIYDSVYGNTEKIARAIGDALGKPGEVKVVRPGEVDQAELQSFDLLVIGSPVQGGRATRAVQDLVNNIPANGLKNVRVATFDTRMRHWVATVLGYAGDRMARTLKKKGASVVSAPGGFIVIGKEGPLAKGEIERAAAWAKGLPGR
jgi:flavodoxin